MSEKEGDRPAVGDGDGGVMLTRNGAWLKCDLIRLTKHLEKLHEAPPSLQSHNIEPPREDFLFLNANYVSPLSEIVTVRGLFELQTPVLTCYCTSIPQ